MNIENLNTNITTFPNEVSEFCLMECKSDFDPNPLETLVVSLQHLLTK